MYQKTPDTVEELKNEGYAYNDFLCRMNMWWLLPDKLKYLGFKASETIGNGKLDAEHKDFYCCLRYPGTREKSLIFQSFEIIPKVHTDNFKYTKDNIYISNRGIKFRHQSILFKPFCDEFGKLFESGILNTVEKHASFYQNMKNVTDNMKILETDKDLKVLTLEDLQSGFVIWLIAVLSAIFVFICEKIYFKITNKQEDWTESKFTKVKNQKKKRHVKKQRPKTKFINVKSVKMV